METYINAVKNALHQLEEIKQSREDRLKELSAFDDLLLSSSTRGGKRYYYARNKNNHHRIYAGTESSEMVCAIREVYFLRNYLNNLNSEIRALRSMLSRHSSIDPNDILRKLPPIYQSHSHSGYSTSDSPARNWLHEKNKIKAQYEVKFPERLNKQAIDGTKLRSKSEVNIANMLILNGIPYIYELPHILNGIEIRPDFTVLSTVDYKTEYIIEHEGLMSEGFYQNMLLKKINTYLTAGKIPGSDVFFTFEGLDGSFDTSPVQDIIETRLKARN